MSAWHHCLHSGPAELQGQEVTRCVTRCYLTGDLLWHHSHGGWFFSGLIITATSKWRVEADLEHMVHKNLFLLWFYLPPWHQIRANVTFKERETGTVTSDTHDQGCEPDDAVHPTGCNMGWSCLTVLWVPHRALKNLCSFPNSHKQNNKKNQKSNRKKRETLRRRVFFQNTENKASRTF